MLAIFLQFQKKKLLITPNKIEFIHKKKHQKMLYLFSSATIYTTYQWQF